MNFADPHQANGLPVDPFSIPYQPHHDAQQNAWVSFQHRNILLLQMLIHHCVSLLRSRGSRLPPMAELKAIGRTYLPRVECKIRTTSTWPIKGLWTIILSHYVSVTPVHLLRSLLLINDSDIRAIEPCICIPQCRTRPASRYPGTSTAQHASGYQFMFPRYLSKTFPHRSI